LDKQGETEQKEQEAIMKSTKATEIPLLLLEKAPTFPFLDRERKKRAPERANPLILRPRKKERRNSVNRNRQESQLPWVTKTVPINSLLLSLPCPKHLQSRSRGKTTPPRSRSGMNLRQL
jgi:hypothetical protein